MDEPNQEPQPVPRPLSVGDRIRIRREELGISLSALADAAGISKSYLHELESNPTAKPSAEVLYNLALPLDTTVGFLLGRRRNPAPVEGEEAPLEIPPSLEEFARKHRIPEDDKRRLACIKYRGQQPKTAEDWAYLYETIRRVTQGK
jgi:transcriptional regulator with XRE-family HTH domain